MAPETATFPEFLWIWNATRAEATPALHLEMARWLHAAWVQGDRRLLLMAFRSAGKSSIVGLFCAWLLSRNPELRILVLAADHALATKMARNVRGIIERHPLCRRLKPRPPDEWAADRFSVAREGAWRDPSMLAAGIGANITGSRADVVICDDVEVPGNSDSPGKRAELRARLAEIEFVLVPGGTHLFVGTPHTLDTIYNVEPGGALAGYARLALPVLDARGESLWPERFSAERIAGLRRRVGPLKFLSQMLLTPVDPTAARLDPARLVRYAGMPELHEGNRETRLEIGGRRMVSASCFWDPAFGAPGTGDNSVLAVLFADAEGGYWLQRVAYLAHDPAAPVDPATQLCRAVVAEAAAHWLPAITVETNGIGRFLPGLLRQELARAGLAAAVIEHANRRPKAERILAGFDAVLAAGRLHAHESVWATPFIAEMREWRPGGGKGRKDDGLDAVAGCLLAEPVRLGRIALPAGARRPGWRGPGAPPATD